MGSNRKGASSWLKEPITNDRRSGWGRYFLSNLWHNDGKRVKNSTWKLVLDLRNLQPLSERYSPGTGRIPCANVDDGYYTAYWIDGENIFTNAPPKEGTSLADVEKTAEKAEENHEPSLPSGAQFGAHPPTYYYQNWRSQISHSGA